MMTFEERIGSAPVRLIVPLTEKFIVSSPDRLFASPIAALSVHAPPASAQVPFPGAASGVSARELTVNVVAACVVGNWQTSMRIKADANRVVTTRAQTRLLGVYKCIWILMKKGRYCPVGK